MATPTAIEKQLYPFATEDSKAIPLDIIRPLAMIKKSFPAAGVAALTIPVDWLVASFFSPTGCFVQFGSATLVNPPVDNTGYVDTLFVPPNCVITSTVINGAATVSSFNLAAGTLVVQQIQKWSGLALSRQVAKI